MVTEGLRPCELSRTPTAELDILVFFCLWNGAVLRNNMTKQLFSSPSRLQSYIDTV